MTTIAIVGAGSGLGASVARRFGRGGFAVALISRTQQHVDDLADELNASGITAAGFRADVADAEALGTALDAAAERLGTIEVLQFSPLPSRDFLQPVLDTSFAQLRAAFSFSVGGSHAAVQHVLPGMRHLGRGTVLLINGASSVRANPKYAGTSVAFAGESAYGQMLHDALVDERIHVGQLVIPRAITPGDETHDPDVLAGLLWSMHAERGEFRRFADALDG